MTTTCLFVYFGGGGGKGGGKLANVGFTLSLSLPQYFSRVYENKFIHPHVSQILDRTDNYVCISLFDPFTVDPFELQ